MAVLQAGFDRRASLLRRIDQAVPHRIHGQRTVLRPCGRQLHFRRRMLRRRPLRAWRRRQTTVHGQARRWSGLRCGRRRVYRDQRLLRGDDLQHRSGPPDRHLWTAPRHAQVRRRRDTRQRCGYAHLRLGTARTGFVVAARSRCSCTRCAHPRAHLRASRAKLR